MFLPDSRRLYSAPCGLRTNWPSRKCTSLYKLLPPHPSRTNSCFNFSPLSISSSIEPWNSLRVSAPPSNASWIIFHQYLWWNFIKKPRILLDKNQESIILNISTFVRSMSELLSNNSNRYLVDDPLVPFSFYSYPFSKHSGFYWMKL